MSFIVWAHHMFITGMGTTMATFFQTTTMIISIPSVVILTALIISLWGGSIRFTTPMLFALGFLPMFGIGGLTGLPLGLTAADIHLHDTYYVIGHFHYVVAPGHDLRACSPASTTGSRRPPGRLMNETLGPAPLLGLARVHERDLHADVHHGPGGRLAPALRRRRLLRPRAARAALERGLVVRAPGAWRSPRSRSSSTSSGASSAAEGRTPTPGRRRRSSGRRPRRRRTATSRRRPQAHRGPYEYSVPGRAAGLLPQWEAGGAHEHGDPLHRRPRGPTPGSTTARSASGCSSPPR